MKKIGLIVFALAVVVLAFGVNYQIGGFNSYYDYRSSSHFNIGYTNLTDKVVDTHVIYYVISKKMINDHGKSEWSHPTSYFNGRVDKRLSPYAEVLFPIFSKNELNSIKPSAKFKNGDNNLYFFAVMVVYEKYNGAWLRTSYSDWEVPIF
ncbi:MAG: hypothetical protein PHY48_16470 [Candidatus Cloacimonetes bacterium]|nr:hypothetical protein [Candidatus Cloacimonadota bacterium]